MVLQTLREHHLYTKLSKCDFYKREVQYLGHIIWEKGVGVDPAKIKVIIEWNILKDVYGIRSFMGLTWYYHIFIENFSRIDNTITTLQKKGIKFVWSQQCQDSFDKLKHLLNTTPILRIVDPNKYFVVCTDASKEEVVGVLTQGGHVICHEARKLK